MRLAAATQVHHTQRLRRTGARAAVLSALLAALLVLGAAPGASAQARADTGRTPGSGNLNTRPPAAPRPSAAQDGLAKARLLYNQQQYDQAIAAAEKVLRMPTFADSARLVIGRSYLEMFRHSANPADLTAGRDALRQVQAALLPVRDQTQLLIGLGETLYLDNAFGPAAEIFSSALGSSTPVDLRDTVLDWWAASLDRLALSGPPEGREDVYVQIVDRMDEELAQDASSTTAAYWLAAASRGAGDIERAWNAAVAGWVRALLSPQRGPALRADLDQLVETAIVPERARLMGGDRDRAIADLKKEWEDVKANWK